MKRVLNHLVLSVLSFLLVGIISIRSQAEITIPLQASHLIAPANHAASQKLLAQAMEPEDLVLQKEKDWKRDYERYFGSIFANKLMSAPGIRVTLQQIATQTGKKAAVIYMVPTPKQLELLLVTPAAQPTQKHVSEIDRQTLLAAVNQFRAEVSDPRKVNTTSYLASAQQLYQWLIAPLETELKAQKIEMLLFCVGAGLRSVPFAALHDGQQFLVEKYSMSLIPGFSLTDTDYTDIQKARVLAMGASQFKALSPLPAVPTELSAIVQRQGGTRFLDSQFTVDNLQIQRQQELYQIIHLATHAEFLPGAASNSYLQFWDTELPLDQLRKLQLNSPIVNLLVLSACKTALGDEQAEMGFAGLAVQAGVKSALGSLWYVSDIGTLGLMIEFYNHLRTTPIKAEVLRQAQIAMLEGHVQLQGRQLRGSRLRAEIRLPPGMTKLEQLPLFHPYYWSAFTLIGSPW